jgi:hypothetical protein
VTDAGPGNRFAKHDTTVVYVAVIAEVQIDPACGGPLSTAKAAKNSPETLMSRHAGPEQQSP